MPETMRQRTMRQRFVTEVGRLLEEDDRAVVVLAVISHALFRDAGLVDRFGDRIIDVGIREQTQIGVAGGLALEGYRPIVTGYAPFLVQRPFEQVKLSLAHQGVGAVLASVGGTWDSAGSGRTHQAPGDVALMRTLPGMSVHVPGHPDELAALLRSAYDGAGSSYLWMTRVSNSRPYATQPGRIVTLRRGSIDAPTLIVVGPIADDALSAVEDLDMTVLYTTTPHPIDRRGLAASVLGEEVLVVEPYLAGTSVGAVAEALNDRPVRIRSHGVTETEFRHYGTPAEHRTAHGLDPTGIRAFVDGRWEFPSELRVG